MSAVSTVIARLKAFGAFLYDFVVGDDWRIALGVVAALGAMYAFRGQTSALWWVLPVVVVAVLTLSVWRAARQSPAAQQATPAPPAGQDAQAG